MPLYPSLLALLFSLLLPFVTSALPLPSEGEEALNEEETLLFFDLPPLQKTLFWMLEKQPTVHLGFAGPYDTPEELDRLLIELYTDNGISPYWVSTSGAQRRAYTLISVLLKAEEEGLDPTRYRLSSIIPLLTASELEDLSRLDLLLSLAFIAYVTDMREGQAVACLLDPQLFGAARSTKWDTLDVLREGLNSPDLELFLAMQAPKHAEYQALKTLLAEYRLLEAQGGWPQLPEGPDLKAGAEDPRLDLLAQRLFRTGDLAHLDAGPFARYEGALVEAVKSFQRRYNLEPDGVLGKDTLRVLNIPVRDHINKIILNMERWRWLPQNLDGRRIFVNIAAFHLTLTSDYSSELTMPVSVGKLKNKTPVFNHSMSYIEVNPYWTIPPSIARNEIVPKMQKNPYYLHDERIRIFAGWQEDSPELPPSAINWQTIGTGINRYRLRQEPGPQNALGRIKFMFPNNKNIYLHDTPSPSQFKKRKRTLSHGCVRVSQPLDLALYILQNDGQRISKKQLQDLIASGKQRVFVLNSTVPVHLMYRTVFVDPATGRAHFYSDIYERDSALAKALFFPEGGDPCPSPSDAEVSP
jgi:murein L,D-transpeptidase YcbB/YkuD